MVALRHVRALLMLLVFATSQAGAAGAPPGDDCPRLAREAGVAGAAGGSEGTGSGMPATFSAPARSAPASPAGPTHVFRACSAGVALLQKAPMYRGVVLAAHSAPIRDGAQLAGPEVVPAPPFHPPRPI